MISSFLRLISNCLTIVILKSYLRDFRCVGGACGGADPWKLITINQLLKTDKPEIRFFKLFSMMRGTTDSGFGRVSEVYDLKGEKVKWVKQGHYYNLILNKESSKLI